MLAGQAMSGTQLVKKTLNAEGEQYFIYPLNGEILFYNNAYFSFIKNIKNIRFQ